MNTKFDILLDKFLDKELENEKELHYKQMVELIKLDNEKEFDELIKLDNEKYLQEKKMLNTLDKLDKLYIEKELSKLKNEKQLQYRKMVHELETENVEYKKILDKIENYKENYKQLLERKLLEKILEKALDKFDKVNKQTIASYKTKEDIQLYKTMIRLERKKSVLIIKINKVKTKDFIIMHELQNSYLNKKVTIEERLQTYIDLLEINEIDNVEYKNLEYPYNHYAVHHFEDYIGETQKIIYNKKLEIEYINNEDIRKRIQKQKIYINALITDYNLDNRLENLE